MDYLAYDFLLNDWRRELLRWFTKRKLNISDRLLDLFTRQSIGKYGFVARITFTTYAEEGKNARVIGFHNLTYEEERDLLDWGDSSSSDED